MGSQSVGFVVKHGHPSESTLNNILLRANVYVLLNVGRGAILNDVIEVQIDRWQTMTSALVMVNCTSGFGQKAAFPGFQGRSQ